MVGEDTVRMSVQELKRVHVIRQAMGKALRQREAGEVLGLTIMASRSSALDNVIDLFPICLIPWMVFRSNPKGRGSEGARVSA